MGVVDIEAKLFQARRLLEVATGQVEKVNPMFREQVQAVVFPLIRAVDALAMAVEGIDREL